MQTVFVNEGVLRVVGGPVEFSCTPATGLVNSQLSRRLYLLCDGTYLNFVPPVVSVELVEVIFHDQTLLCLLAIRQET